MRKRAFLMKKGMIFGKKPNKRRNFCYNSLQNNKTEVRSVKVTWLGQAGLLIQTGQTTVMIDPYLSNSVFKMNPANDRRVPVDERFLNIRPDVLCFTHNHLDHFDPETVDRLIGPETGILVLSPSSVWADVRRYGGNQNYVVFDRHTQWTHQDVRFTAVKAVHSDPGAIGFVVEAEGKTLYVSGDTLYSTDILNDLPDGIDAAFLPVNGVGNNMNMTDAARFAKATGARQVVPLHIGLFDSLKAEDFPCANRLILTMYQETEL